MKTTHKLAMVFLGVLVAVTAPAAVGFTVQQPAYAQLVKDPGASFFAPGEEPLAPGWDPNGAEEDAAGQDPRAEGWMPMEAVQDSPGVLGLEAEIVGPDLPKK
jgi:hypothetical protein